MRSKKGILFFERSCFIPEIFKFFYLKFAIDHVTSGLSKNIYHKIKNIFGNI